MYGLSAKKMAVVESSRWPFVEVRLQEMDSKVGMFTQVRYLLPRPNVQSWWTLGRGEPTTEVADSAV